MIYILTGGPATGKGTRSDILANALEIPHISTGDMLRNVAKKNLEIREKLSNGELISDEIITDLLEQRILEDDWTTVTVDGSDSAHYEHTIVITEDGYEILTTEEGSLANVKE